MSTPRALYTLAVGLSAALLFLVQPMLGRLVLPQLGGSPLVWNTCMLFFQTALLCGYAYSHLLTRRLRPRFQVLVHAVVLALALPALPIALRAAEPSGAGSPLAWLLAALAVSAGVPFFALSATGPLLQRWFASTPDPRASDPYFLYAVSNAGSLAALLAYPTLIEPNLPLVTSALSQAGLWSVGYAASALLTIGCGVVVLRTAGNDGRSHVEARAGVAPIAWRRRLRWIALAFCPSAAMLGATQFITTDLAAIPLLWIVPLSIYLVTFILAFMRRPLVPARIAGIALAVLVAATMAGFGLRGALPLGVSVPLHLATLFAVGIVCHGRLAADRPAAEQLTEYYLLVGVGGALGGLFCSVVAPMLFDSILEYPLVLWLACFLRPPGAGARRAPTLHTTGLDVAIPVGIALVATVLVSMSANAGREHEAQWAVARAAIPAALVLLTLARPLRFAIGILVLFALAWLPARGRDQVIHQERTFFGVHRVSRFTPRARADGRPSQLPSVHSLHHGTTKHGAQILQDPQRRIPTLYYHPDGPLGAVLRKIHDQPSLRVGVIGLGVGAIAAYGLPGQRFTFFEIDPAVARIASDPRYFTYLSDSRSQTEIVLGDGRLSIARTPDGSFDLIVVDAFSSDSVPVHLITREALELYLRKLREGGVLALHFTSSYVDLEPVLDALVADLRLAGAVWRDRAPVVPRQILEGKAPSTWAIVARSSARIDALGIAREAGRLPRRPGAVPQRRFLWTDDYSNLIAALGAR